MMSCTVLAEVSNRLSPNLRELKAVLCRTGRSGGGFEFDSRSAKVQPSVQRHTPIALRFFWVPRIAQSDRQIKLQSLPKGKGFSPRMMQSRMMHQSLNHLNIGNQGLPACKRLHFSDLTFEGSWKSGNGNFNARQFLALRHMRYSYSNSLFTASSSAELKGVIATALKQNQRRGWFSFWSYSSQ